ncbi:MFS transporter [Azoarcus sp. KH32C]|uniref:MFS transporter n=1 Tax=Azoarcus sp. KH32C TaxID=748247 RepID=UPI0002385CBE|nr:MFS transporter [Azoarcus sp. KH32C]BAL27469.1 major facilitator superfamily MFS_1 [Azoarcus sp. KH32C]
MATYVADASTIPYTPSVSRSFAWIVFALTFGLLISDYMSRQVLNAVFPVLKAEWGLSDTQLGSLNSIVALLVGMLSFPLSVLADRWGRVRSIVLMAGLWSLATMACALAEGYAQMFVARFFVGLGEAAYGSVGIALILSVFPPHLRSSLTAAFMAGGAMGSVLGMALGGVVATHLGWRWAFGAMAVFGLGLVVLYALIVTERRLSVESVGAAKSGASESKGRMPCPGLRKLFGALFSSVSVVCAYIGSGLQLFVMASLIAWLPSYANRYYDLPPDRAGLVAAAFVLIGAIGMTCCGIITDRLSRTFAIRKWLIAMAYSVASCALLLVGFHVPAGPMQFVIIGLGMFFVAGTTGPAGAMVANLTHASIHASAFATLTLANNLLGLAPGPFLTGFLADRIGLLPAMQLMPLSAVAASVAFAVGYRHYEADLARMRMLHPHSH